MYIPTISRPYIDFSWKGLKGRAEILDGGAGRPWGTIINPENMVRIILGVMIRPETHAVYVCGHPGTVDGVVETLSRRGFHVDRDIKREKYYPEPKFPQRWHPRLLQDRWPAGRGGQPLYGTGRMASRGVAIRDWSCVAVPAGRMPGITYLSPFPNFALSTGSSLAEATTPAAPDSCAISARRSTQSAGVSGTPSAWMSSAERLVSAVTARIKGASPSLAPPLPLPLSWPGRLRRER